MKSVRCNSGNARNNSRCPQLTIGLGSYFEKYQFYYLSIKKINGVYIIIVFFIYSYKNLKIYFNMSHFGFSKMSLREKWDGTTYQPVFY